jgi:tetratricopeptide (TPR) repeat protein
MAYPRKAPFVTIAVALALAAAVLPAQSPAGGSTLAEGIDLFRKGLYEKSIPVFDAVIRGSEAPASKPEASFLLAKSHMAVGNLDEAERTLGQYIETYPQATDYPEALYQKGRLLYMREQLEPAVQVLQGFLSAYPKSAFVPNAYFWVGESLYALGKLDQALTVFRKVVRDFPASFKAEAAQYRVSLIELGRKEAELAKLLKWSHENSLKTIEEFQRRERAYEQAIEAYQKRLAASSAGQYAPAPAAVVAAPVPPSPSAEELEEIARIKELLALKEEALALKERYLSELQAAAESVK